MSKANDDAHTLGSAAPETMPAPDLPYRPPVPKTYRPKIGLIGCGGISKTHLEAYRSVGYNVAALCDPIPAATEERRKTYFPDAETYQAASDLLARPDIDVVDITTHPDVRAPLIREALGRGKHVLSQKPFVTDLATGRELVELAERNGLKLAVNQNGRWAPYFSYLRQAVKAGLLGDIASVDIQIAWDHSWIKGTPFEKIRHILLYDFAIHWFDIVACIFGDRPARQVYARADPSIGQELAPPMNAQAMVQYEGGMASLAFHANTPFGPEESVVVAGTQGTFRSAGPVCGNDRITLSTAEGQARIELTGQWFPDGFSGAMGELLCAIEEDREPENSARANLRSLELCFAAVASAESGQPVDCGTIQKIHLA